VYDYIKIRYGGMEMKDYCSMDFLDVFENLVNGIKTELVKYNTGTNAGKFGVRIYDTDAERVYKIIFCKTELDARKIYKEAISL
jgi:hypothetical protein